MKGQEIGLFDFDGCLVKCDSFLKFSIFSLGSKRVIWGIIRSLTWLFKWKTGIVTSSVAKERLFGKLFRGMPYETFVSNGERFAARIDNMLNEEVVAQLERLLNRGVECVIVTASMPDWILPWAHRHGIHTVIGTEPMVGKDGCLTGLFRTPNCKGKHKVIRLREQIPGIGHMEVHAWGNLPDDKEMFRLAKHPHVI